MSYLDRQMAHAASFRFRAHLFRHNRLEAYNKALLAAESDKRQAIQDAFDSARQTWLKTKPSSLAIQIATCHYPEKAEKMIERLIDKNLNGGK